MFFRFGLLYWLGSAAFGYFLVSYLNQYVTAATHFSFFWTIWWVNRLLYPSTRVIYYLYCSYRQRPLTVQLKMEYSIIPLVHLSLELQPLLQLASSDVNLTCGVINKFSIRSFNSWVPLGLGLWLKWGRPAGTRMIIQSLQRCFHKYVRRWGFENAYSCLWNLWSYGLVYSIDCIRQHLDIFSSRTLTSMLSLLPISLSSELSDGSTVCSIQALV